MIELPAEIPESNPVTALILPLILLLLHTPPKVLLVNCVVDPAQRFVLPVIGDTVGNRLTVTTVPKLFELLTHPLPFVTKTVNVPVELAVYV